MSTVCLIINDKKSGIVEFVRRRGPSKQTLAIGSLFEGIPILHSYKYLGLYLDNRLTIKPQLAYINDKVKFICFKFRPLLDNISAGYRKNLWSTFIRPLFELLAILHASEPALSNRLTLERAFRRSFQGITKVGRTTPLAIQELLVGMDLGKRGKFLWDDSVARWRCRVERREYDTARILPKDEGDVLKFAPKRTDRAY